MGVSLNSLASPENLKALASLAAWYACNVFTVILNKWIFQEYGFTFPLTLTIVHFVTCWIGAVVVLRVLRIIPLIQVSTQDVSRKLLPFSILFCTNIVLGNISLRWVPVSFMQTIKAAVPACTIALQILAQRMKFDRRIYISLIPVVGGVMLASWTEVNFNWAGFLTAVAACWTTAAQTVLSGMIMQFKFDPVNLLYYMAPLSLFMLAPFAFVTEVSTILARPEFVGNTELMTVLLISGVIAFLLNWTTFLAIQCTSSLTFNVSGNLKSVIAIIVSVLIFKNEIGLLNALGCLVALGGVGWYGLLRHEIAEKERALKSAKVIVEEATSLRSGESESLIILDKSSTDSAK
mmetsp:Transcript_18102/g.29739  ORF Transcript_18102/g.29739 Transcript_18102/m.29739 type:complete len:349 (+) Transcript_18102:267-1313(+)|eukprot:CAMPEP_0184663394 /NCGR_PEP_ID=MMETSP0308-20130426/47951_1 /TAXON_ID=38269 /ORGANISM="Gloeochaete witrockiana, Strain SAG 46.84" /LENGTH=348 /DNA_ID=CAMNT_0027106103 /DNA_START=140 /DNA_END=1186 /DNA_ORIENTATION=-